MMMTMSRMVTDQLIPQSLAAAMVCSTYWTTKAKAAKPPITRKLAMVLCRTESVNPIGDDAV